MRKIIAGLICVLLLTTMAGCSLKTDSELLAEKGGGAAFAAEGKDIYNEEIRIAFLPNVIGDSMAAAWSGGMEDYLSNFPNISMDVFDGKASVDTQVQIMDELINQQYDAILLQATDAAGLAASVEKAEANGIPVITMNLDAETPHTCLVAAVDVEAGRNIAQAMGESLGGKGKVVIISATPGAAKGENIDKGFKTELADQYPDMEILDEQSGEWLTENANTVMNDFLTKYPDIDAVLCHNDAMAEGAAEAVKAAGLNGKIQIWGADGESKMLEYISQGLCTGTIYTDAKAQGQTAVQLALFAVASGVTGGYFTETPVIKMAPVVVTQENVDSIPEELRW